MRTNKKQTLSWGNAQWIEGLAVKPDDLGSRPDTYVMERKRADFCKLSSDLHKIKKTKTKPKLKWRPNWRMYDFFLLQVETDRSLELTGQLFSPQVPPSETGWVNPEEQDLRLTSGFHPQAHIHVLAHSQSCTHIHAHADTYEHTPPPYTHTGTFTHTLIHMYRTLGSLKLQPS